MIYLVNRIVSEPGRRDRQTVVAQHERLQDAADDAIRLRKENPRYEYRIQTTAEPLSRNLVGWVYPLDEGEPVQ